MIKTIVLVLGLSLLTAGCRAEPRWCSVSKRDPSNTIVYPPISVAAQVGGEARALILYKPNDRVERVEPISGVAMLSEPLDRQLMNWTVKTNESGEDLCKTLVIAVFTLHPPARARRGHQKVKFAREQNAIRVTISTNYPEIETDSAQAARD